MSLTERGMTVQAAVDQAERKRDGERTGAQERNAQRNWQEIFATIVRVDGPSAQEIARITGLGPSTVTGVLKRMERRNLIRLEQGERTGRGRRPRPVRVNNQDHHVAGVEIRSDRLTGLVADLHGRPVDEPQTVELDAGVPGRAVDVDMVVDRIRDLVEALSAALGKARGGDQAPLLGLGVELGGHVDGRTGRVVFSPNLRWGERWRTGQVPLRQLLRAATRLHTVVDNDANALGIAQQYFGAARGEDHFTVVLVTRNGVGSAEFRGGELHRGASGRAGEVGHLVIAPGGRVCRCGRRGCVEAVSTQPAILEAVQASDFAEALRRSADGDPAARQAFTDAGTALGRGVAALLTLNDPGKVLFTGEAVTRSDSGGLVLFNEDYHRAVLEAVRDCTAFSEPSPADFQLVLDEERWNGARGAATMVIRDIIAGAVEV